MKPLTPAERQASDDLFRLYGEYVEPETVGLINGTGRFNLVADESDIPGKVPAGFGLLDVVQARKALDDARNSGDVQRTLDAHNAWLDLAEELPLAVEQARRLSVRAVQRAGAIGAIGGTALGFGLAELLRLVVR